MEPRQTSGAPSSLRGSGLERPTRAPSEPAHGSQYREAVQDHLPQAVRVERRPVDESESRRANGPDWDRYADEYQATHGEFLGDAGFVWGPEGQTEDDLGILGDVAGRDVLEVGQRRRAVLALGAHPRRSRRRPRPLAPPAPAQPAHRRDHRGRGAVGAGDRHAPALRRRHLRRRLLLLRRPAVRARHRRRRRRDGAGAPARRALRLLRSPTRRGGCSPTTPARAASSPRSPTGTARRTSRSTTRPASVAYVEHHRTLGDWVRLLAAHGFHLVDLVEPEWPADHDRVWGGWSRTRGPADPGHRDLRRRPALSVRTGPRPRDRVGTASPPCRDSGRSPPPPTVAASWSCRWPPCCGGRGRSRVELAGRRTV